MQTFTEWTDRRIKMTFAEKYMMLTNRLGTLNSMKMAADTALKNTTSTGGVVVGCCGCGGTEGKSLEELVQDVDQMWAELKKEIITSVKTHQKSTDKAKKD